MARAGGAARDGVAMDSAGDGARENASPDAMASGEAADAGARRIVRLTLLGFAAYCLALLGLKWFGFSAAVFDYAKEIYHARELRWIYDAANPPLYTWLLLGLQQAMGARLGTVLILNHLLLFGIFAASFALAREALRSPVLAALAAWSLMLVGQYHKFLYVMTHSLLAAIACPAALWLMLRIAREGRRRDYLALGAVLGLGLLSKFLVLAAFAAMVAAALAGRATRARVLSLDFAMTLGVAAAVFAPFAIAGIGEWPRLAGVFAERTGRNQASGYFSGLADGAWSLTQGVVVYAAALALVAGLAILWARRPGARSAAGAPAFEAQANGLRLVRATVIAGLVLIAIGVLAAGISVVKPRFLHIFLYPLPILAVALVARLAPGRPALRTPALRTYGILLGLVGAAVLAVRAVNLSPACLGRCEDLEPFDRLAARLAGAGFQRGTILAHGVRLGGNLALHFPDARVDVVVDPFKPAPPPSGRRGQCLIVWQAGRGGGPALPKALIEVAGLPEARARVAARGISLDWRWHGLAVVDPARDWRPRRTGWRYILIPEGTPTCR